MTVMMAFWRSLRQMLMKSSLQLKKQNQLSVAVIGQGLRLSDLTVKEKKKKLIEKKWRTMIQMK